MIYNEDKTGFVKEFGELLNKYGIENVIGMNYTKDKNDEENVIVYFEGGSEISVNVNCDSLSAIIRDVMKEL